MGYPKSRSKLWEINPNEIKGGDGQEVDVKAA
jgi:hypothetical protein